MLDITHSYDKSRPLSELLTISYIRYIINRYIKIINESNSINSSNNKSTYANIASRNNGKK